MSFGTIITQLKQHTNVENRKNVRTLKTQCNSHHKKLFVKWPTFLSRHSNKLSTYSTNEERELMLLKNSGSHTMPKNNNKKTNL